MPERVTKEERQISMLIEKAREAKELLHLSLNQNNINPAEDESEHIKVKRPKAENVDVEIKPDGKHNGLGLDSSAYAGGSFKKAEGYDMVLENIKDTKDAESAIESFLQVVSSRVHYDKPTVPVPEKLMSMVRDYLEMGFDKKEF